MCKKILSVDKIYVPHFYPQPPTQCGNWTMQWSASGLHQDRRLHQTREFLHKNVIYSHVIWISDQLARDLYRWFTSATCSLDSGLCHGLGMTLLLIGSLHHALNHVFETEPWFKLFWLFAHHFCHIWIIRDKLHSYSSLYGVTGPWVKKIPSIRIFGGKRERNSSCCILYR